DANYLYVGVHSVDPEPSEVLHPFARRDKVFSDQDMLQLMIDAAGDRGAAQIFRVGAGGGIGDGIYTEANGEDFSPDYEFSAAASLTGDGWSAEYRIPFSSLGYSGSGKKWHILLVRALPRGDRIRLTNGPVPTNTNCMLCFAPEVDGLSDLPQGLSWTLTPQLLASSRSDEVDGKRSHKNELQPSLDAKLRLNPQTVFDVTLNPDFSQVEIDAPTLSGDSRFATFLDEKRPFFLEGADLLQTPLRAIHTRSITDPAWGARATVRSDAASFTILTNLDDGGGSVVLPGAYGNGSAPQSFHSQATVARAHTHFGDFSYGALLTDRTLSDGRGYNRVVGPDFGWQLDKETRVRGQLLLSSTTSLPGIDGQLRKGREQRDHAALLELSRSTEDWNIFAKYSDIGRHFRADNGFLTQSGVNDAWLEVTRRFHRDGDWRELNPYVNLGYTQSSEGDMIWQAQRFGLALAGPRNSSVNIEWRPNEQVRLDPDGAWFAGKQPLAPWRPVLKRDYLHVVYDGSPAPSLGEVRAEVDIGDQIDYENARLGRGGQASLLARWRPFNHLEIEQHWSRYWVDGRAIGLGRVFTETTYQWNSIWHFNASDTLRFIWQRDEIARNQAGYQSRVDAKVHSDAASLVYAHRRGLGTALYIGASSGFSNDGGKSRQREVFVKASWAI
uniref:DUF5916 domain-containing protein n=1 Tax=Chitinimonas sp. TaxID=1934313 RepID=UPI0035AFD66B